MPQADSPRPASAAVKGRTNRGPSVDALAKLLRAHELGQVTRDEALRRFEQLVNVYGSADTAAPDRAATPRATQLEHVVDGQAVATLRPIGWGDGNQPPEGWRVAVVPWEGTECEVFFDPRHVSSVMTLPNVAVSDQRRSQLQDSGWSILGSDRAGNQLWVQQPRIAAEARLNALRNAPQASIEDQRGAEPPQVSL
jgi:hypothetical protein